MLLFSREQLAQGVVLPSEVLLLFPPVCLPDFSCAVGDPTQLPLLGEEAGNSLDDNGHAM